jgi:hypothetical protein
MSTSAVDVTIGSAAMATTTKPKEGITESPTQSTGVSMDDMTSHTGMV